MSAAVERRSARYLPEDWTLPLLCEENRAFFTSGQLMLQVCEACGAVQHPPMDLCRCCQGTVFAYRPASGAGCISSYTIVHRAADPRLEVAIPYNVVIVELDDHQGVMVVGNVIDAAPGDLVIGRPVRATFAVVADAEGPQPVLLPQWELA